MCSEFQMYNYIGNQGWLTAADTIWAEMPLRMLCLITEPWTVVFMSTAFFLLQKHIAGDTIQRYQTKLLYRLHFEKTMLNLSLKLVIGNAWVTLRELLPLPLQVCAITTVRAGKRGGLTGMCVNVLCVKKACILQYKGLILILRLRGRKHVSY